MSTKINDVSSILSDALMRCGDIDDIVMVYTTKDGTVNTSYSCSRIMRLGLMQHFFMFEQAVSNRDVNETEHEEVNPEEDDE